VITSPPKEASVSQIVLRVSKIFAAFERLTWIPILLARLAMGYEFLSSGLGKIKDIPKLTAYFVELGIPMPGVNAALTATTELICGLLLLLGLGTRFAAAALTCVMTVAILTAKLKEAHTLSDFLYLSEPAFVVIFIWLVFSGAGKMSLDHLIAKRLGARPEGAPSPGHS
jgi:putative oxidoreductase